MLRDFSYAVRTLRSSRVFTVTAVVTLTLGIGASTAIFSVADAVLLRPIPYKDPDRLVYACSDQTRRNVYDQTWSDPDYFDLRNHASDSLEDVAAVRTARGSLAHEDGTPDEIAYALVTPNFFRMLGIRVVMGRDFNDGDGVAQATSGVAPSAPIDPRLPTYAIASKEFFQRRFGGDTAKFGQTVGKNGPILVGVLEPGVELLFRPEKSIERRPELWLCARLNYNSSRITLPWRVIGRLRKGVTLRRAQAQADAVAEQSRAANAIVRGMGFAIRLEPMQPYLVSQVRPAILSLMGAVIFLLLIACSNVANLFLIRASLRSRDLAVRTAMGATWWRLASQTLAEALLVGGTGSAFGFGLAWLGIRNLLAIAPATIPRADAIRMNPAVLAFGIGAGLTAAVLFGLAPVLRAARPDVAQVLRAGGRTGALSGGTLLRNSVVVAEVALCFVLLVGSSLMFRSFLALQRINPGFDPHGLLMFKAVGGPRPVAPEERAALVRQMQSTLAAIPGVESVTATDILPLTSTYFPWRWGKEDALADPGKFQAMDVQTVLPGYFETMRIPLLAGRTFSDADNSPQVRRLVIDQSLAAKAFPDRSAVGQRILSRFVTPDPEWFEVVGVVAHQRLDSLAEPGREQAFLTDGYWGHRLVSEWAVRTQGDPAKYAAAVRAAIAKLNRTYLLTEVQTMDSVVERAETGTRFSLLLIAIFAGIAALLAAVGLYGVLSTVVRQRTAEIGVRMALGAAPAGVFGLMMGYGLRLSVAGVAAGLAAALLLTRAMTSMLVGIKPTDPLSFGAMALLFLVIAVAATWIPARRAAALDPSSALRQE